MSGEDIPYQLRPNKFIDRQVFIDLLARIVPSIGAENYIYVSMGGKHLVDHSAIYRQVGITKLFSFDRNQQTVDRQTFNRPIDNVICEAMDSGSLPGSLDRIMGQFAGATNFVLWLDYTDAKNRLSQIQELIEIAKRAQPGDIIRITLNASLSSLDGPKGSTIWKDEGYDSPKLYRIAKLRDQLSELVPVGIEGVGDDDFPSILCRCIGLAYSKVEGERHEVAFRPILNTTYRDGTRMVTVTCIVTRRQPVMGQRDPLDSWDLMPRGWYEVTSIVAPELSIREKLRIDEHLSLTAAQVAEKLSFKLGASDEKSIEAITSYQRLHRYYPSFHHIEH